MLESGIRLEAVADGCASTPTEVAHTATIRNEEAIGGTSVNRNHQGEGELVLNTYLTANAKTKTVVLAVVEVQTRTNIPVEVVNNVEHPVVSTSQVELHVVGTEVVNTKVEFKTVGTETMLEGKFSTIVHAIATKTCADSILCVSCEAESNNSNQKYEKFLHNELNFKYKLIIALIV